MQTVDGSSPRICRRIARCATALQTLFGETFANQPHHAGSLGFLSRKLPKVLDRSTHGNKRVAMGVLKFLTAMDVFQQTDKRVP